MRDGVDRRTMTSRTPDCGSSATAAEVPAGPVPHLVELGRSQPVGLIPFPLLHRRLGGQAVGRLVLAELPRYLRLLPFHQRRRSDGNAVQSAELDLAAHPAVGIDLQIEPHVLFIPVGAKPARHGPSMPDEANTMSVRRAEVAAADCWGVARGGVDADVDRVTVPPSTSALPRRTVHHKHPAAEAA